MKKILVPTENEFVQLGFLKMVPHYAFAPGWFRVFNSKTSTINFYCKSERWALEAEDESEGCCIDLYIESLDQLYNILSALNVDYKKLD